ncbi:MAG: M48 metallopeptidase family protein, partial [Anaerolineales bacterium]
KLADQKYRLKDLEGKQVDVWVRPDKRLKKFSRWERQKDGSILLRVPYRFPKRQIGSLLDQIALQLASQKQMAERRTDAELQQRAHAINRKYFGSKIEWKAIRWVGNMEKRLGSCTSGGPTDGHIRISEKIKNWPDWVVDYVIAHELVHRIHSNHSPAFWDMLTSGYPLTERARGFIKGVGFMEGTEYGDEN